MPESAPPVQAAAKPDHIAEGTDDSSMAVAIEAAPVAPLQTEQPIVVVQPALLAIKEPKPGPDPAMSLDAAGLVMIETRSDRLHADLTPEPAPSLGRARRFRAAPPQEPLVQVETQK
jgi:hypothetical protein